MKVASVHSKHEIYCFDSASISNAVVIVKEDTHVYLKSAHSNQVMSQAARTRTVYLLLYWPNLLCDSYHPKLYPQFKHFILD